MINLEVPKKFEQLVDQAHMVATEIFRKNSRKYDLAEHEYPKELDMLAAVIEGSNPSGAGAGSGGVEATGRPRRTAGIANGSNMASLLGLTELCWGRRRAAADDAPVRALGQGRDRGGRRR